MLYKLNFTLCLLLTGLIWTIQIVHYPLFLKIKEDTFPAYLKMHQKLITPLVAPLMIIELILSFCLFVSFLPNFTLFSILQCLLVVVIWFSTFLIQVPLHQKLTAGFNKIMCKKLIKSNWIRTICWSLRTIILLAFYEYN